MTDHVQRMRERMAKKGQRLDLQVGAPPSAPPLKVQSAPAVVATPSPKPPAAKQPGQRPPPPPTVSHETVTHSCGHQVQFGCFADKLDKHRDARRKKLTDVPCKECRQKKHAEKIATDQAAAAERRKGQEPRAKSRKLKGRLPDKAVFVCEYDATAERWSGTLAIPGRPDIVGNNSGIFPLLQWLDRRWRDVEAGTLYLAPPTDGTGAGTSSPDVPPAATTEDSGDAAR